MTGDGLIRVKREGAKRARRLATFITSEEDKARMLAFANELDAQADALEAAVKPPAPVTEQQQGIPPQQVTQQQVQVQQGPPASEDDEEKK